MTNLILGHCARVQARRLEPFIASLRRTEFRGDVCLFVEDVVADELARLREYGVIVCRAASSSPPAMTARASRYFNFLNYLAARSQDYANVLLVDPVDTIVQSDPFAIRRPADIVFTQIRRRIGSSPEDHDAIVLGYGETMALNVRDCMVSNASVTIASASGMLRYLAAMTTQISSRDTVITAAIDRGVHNCLVRMHPLADAWVDADDQFAVAIEGIVDDALEIAEQGISIDGRLVPLVAAWHGNTRISAHVAEAHRFRLDADMQGPPAAVASPPPVSPRAPARNAIVAFFQKGRDEDWLPFFLQSLHCVAPDTIVHCIGDFGQREQERLAHAACTSHPVTAVALDVCDNVAHVHLNEILQILAADPAGPPDQVLVLDTMRAVFPRDPFATATIGLSVFCESHERIADSEYNRTRLGFYLPEGDSRLALPVISSAALRGSIPVLRAFYQALFAELLTRQDVLSVTKVVQGALNKLCHLGHFSFPVVVHPNGAELYFDFWESGLSLDSRHGFKVGGTVPGVVLGSHLLTKAMVKLRTDLGLRQG
ncbi:MAG TPA: hypothetical protein VL614_13820 [Acetobacteraceae bacterium]|nr:hypothetical protein [Acetobacteraceae bacterium]